MLLVLHHLISLVPGSFPIPVFDHFQYAKYIGEAWETLCRQMVDAQGTVHDKGS